MCLPDRQTDGQTDRQTYRKAIAIDRSNRVRCALKTRQFPYAFNADDQS